ncbi:IclR family transcriptional regulator domain-containing protein [Amycolatopsis pithecellobii]|uniref:Glycerol operon regulatory protein n=1 Tax=Amycolatopsis pithecellobii TaxID=664692 RepID=A0A6N7Z2Y5_9PSEU|nr:IclR family transcriptional regulator C-terminal domain-containing protein [Amycolatopsis pithecellobii]MTD54491.1 helix-turn-helix domain-containing protein [Amycolatopsis pithecellobii]
MSSEGLGPFVRTFDRGLDVLTCFSADRAELSAAEVAARCGFDPATARRLLRTLESLGYVDGAGGRYRLTAKVLDLGYLTIASQTFPEIVQPYLEDVAQEVDHSCSLAVLDGDTAVFVARAAVRRVMSIRLAPGTRVPAAASAVGRALLSGLTDEQLTAHFTRFPPVAYTDRTITDPRELLARIAEVRAQGWALIDQELERGVRSVSVPLHDAAGAVVAAVTIGTHTGQIDDDTLFHAILPHLQTCAAAIERTVTIGPVSATMFTGPQPVTPSSRVADSTIDSRPR